jgi:5-methylcytosine-specific restriction endonuclease McrA
MTHVWKAREKRETLCKRQRNRCYWCGVQMNRRHLDPLSATLDHYTPRSRGGGGSIDNLVAACKDCNEARGRGDELQPYEVGSRRA